MVEYLSIVTNLLTAIGHGVLGSGASGLLADQIAKITETLDIWQQQGLLPEDHDIERGVERAALVATQVAVCQIDRDLLADNPLLTKISIAGAELNFQAYANLHSRLARNIALLACDVAVPAQKKLKNRNYQAALNESGLNISAAAMADVARLLVAMITASPASQTVIPWRQVNELLLPIAQAVVKQIIRFGGWPEGGRSSEVEGCLKEYLFAENALWFNLFAQSFAKEIVADPALSRLASLHQHQSLHVSLSNLHAHSETIQEDIQFLTELSRRHAATLGNKLDNVGHRIAELVAVSENILQEARSSLAVAGDKIFSPPHLEQSDYLRPFYFASEEDPWIEREDISSLIEEKFLSPSLFHKKFLWMALCGEAGTGKSRLALQILHEYSHIYRLSGFVRQGFIHSLDIVNFTENIITGPALFICDYAGSAAKAHRKFIERCALIASAAKFPIRVMLLMRRPSEHFFDDIEYEQQDGASALKSQVRFAADNVPGARAGVLLLQPLNTDETLRLMRNRMERGAAISEGSEAVLSLTEISDRELLASLDYFDSARRPLFALMVADALQQQSLPKKRDKDNQEQSRLALFSEYLVRQYHRQWKYAGDLDGGHPVSSELNKVDQHVNLLILSTMARGLADSGMDRLRNHAQYGKVARSLLPYRPDDYDHGFDAIRLQESGILQAISGVKRMDEANDPYPTLEPDLIGESLVILALTKSDRYVINYPGSSLTAQRQKHLANMAWIADPEGAAYFAYMLAQDFPQTAVLINWMLPPLATPESALSRSNLLRNLSADIIYSIRGRPAELGDLQQVARIIVFLTKDYSRDFPAETKKNIAVTLRDTARHMASLINKAIAPGETLYPVKIVDKKMIYKSSFSVAATAIDGFGLRGEGVFSQESHGLVSGRVMEFAKKSEDKSDVQAIYQHQISDSVRSLAQEILETIYSAIYEILFCEDNYEIHNIFADAMRLVIVSLFWQNRDKKNLHGFSPVALSDNDLAQRNRIVQRCKTAIEKENISESDLSVAARTTAALIYAGENDFQGSYELLFCKIISMANGMSILYPQTVTAFLAFLNNYLFLSIRDHDENSDSDNSQSHPVEKNPTAEKIYTVIDSLFVNIKSLSLSSDDAEKITSSWCGCALRVLFCKRNDSDISSAKERLATQFLELMELNPGQKISSNMIDFLTGIIAPEGAMVGKDVARRKLLAIFSRSDFDLVSLNNVSWKNLKDFFQRMIFSLDYQAERSLQRILKKLCISGGENARSILLKIAVDNIPKYGFKSDRANRILSVFNDFSLTNNPDSSEQFRSLVLNVCAQYLLEGDRDYAFSWIERCWCEGSSYTNYHSRLIAFNVIELSSLWCSDSDVVIDSFLLRCKLLIETDVGENQPLIPRSMRILHDIALTDVYVTLFKKSMAAGCGVYQWINFEGKNMESKIFDRLYSNLAQAIFEKIQAEAESVEYAITENNLDLIRSLTKKSPVIRPVFRKALQFVLNLSDFPDESLKKLEREFELLFDSYLVDNTAIDVSGDGSKNPLKCKDFYNLLQPARTIRLGLENHFWQPVTGDSLASFLDEINKIDGKYEVDIATSQVAWAYLPFYKDVALIRVVDSLWLNEHLVVYYLSFNQHLFRLNGTSPPIHEINKKVPIALTEENITDYLKFFCFFVQGDEGPFYILESLDDIMLPQIDCSTTLSIFEREVKPVRKDGMDNSGNFLCEAVIFYSNAIFSGSFVINPNGMMDLASDTPIAGELPIRMNTPLA